MSNDKQEHSVQEVPIASSHDEAFKARRRRLVGTGLGASAIISTVVSRPAWATSACSKSGLESANLSGRHPVVGCGKSAGFWKTKQYAWPAEVSPAASFTSLFGSAPCGLKADGTINYLYEGMSLGQVITLEGSNNQPNPGNFGKHLVGAYINSIAFPRSGNRGFVFSSSWVVTLFTNAKSEATGKSTEVQETIYRTYAKTLEDANKLYNDTTEWDHKR